jgi:hypothetical protein
MAAAQRRNGWATSKRLLITVTGGNIPPPRLLHIDHPPAPGSTFDHRRAGPTQRK